MGNVIRLPGDAHQATQQLLPWYAAGTLDEADRAFVAAHLETCARCRADLNRERQLGTELRALPVDVERGWAAMTRRLDEDATASPPSPSGQKPARLSVGRAGPWLGWAAAAGLAGVLALSSLAPRPTAPARYHTLASPAAAPVSGNVVVMFRPEATQAEISAALQASGARIADGPTSVGAYILRVPPEDLDRGLRSLRGRRAVAMAEPVSAAPP